MAPDELEYQKKVIHHIIVNSKDNYIEELGKYVIREKNGTIRLLNFMYGIIITCLLVIIYTQIK